MAYLFPVNFVTIDVGVAFDVIESTGQSVSSCLRKSTHGRHKQPGKNFAEGTPYA
jgi:hypothetical protein